MSKILGTRLRAARKALHPEVTQRAAAKRMGMSPSAVNLWESGRTEPGADHLAELARWYGVSTDWLVGLEARPAAKQARPPIWTVPVVTGAALAKWQWDTAAELLQTSVAYPPHTAAAFQVSSDALTSTCPSGCHVVVSKAHPCLPGNIVMAAVSRVGDPVVRKYIKEGRDQLLIADDTRYPSLKLADGVRLIGRVTEVVARRVLL